MLADKPLKVIVPSVPPQVDGLVLVALPITGRGFTTTVVQACGLGQFATVSTAQ